VQLREFVAPDAINLDLKSTEKEDVLRELVGLLKLDEKSDAMLVKMLKRRETLGSTGIGQNIAIPHRSLVVDHLRVAFAGSSTASFRLHRRQARALLLPDRRPPLEVSNQYLPCSARSRSSRRSRIFRRLATQDAQEFLSCWRRRVFEKTLRR
jgi:hypothetical protein